MGSVQNVKDNNQINASKQESISSNPVVFKNSKTLPESLQRLEDIPLNVIKSLVSSYLLVITSILDKMLETLGLEMGDPDALEENLEKATERIKFMTWVMIQVLKDEEVRENIRQLAIALNDSALKPFLQAALLTLDEMQPFNERMVEILGVVIDQHGISPEYAIEITSMWGNIQPQGHAFHRHSHHNNMFAGVYYVNQSENRGIANRLKGFPHLLFWNDRRDHQLSPKRNPNHPFNRYNFPVEVKKDLLVIFPAWLEHEVGQNTSTKDRISISFNIMLRGRFGEINSKESSIM